VPIDTGYEGSIMLPPELYEFFSMAELPRTLWRIYRTLTGTVITRVARVRARVAETELEALVESPLYGRGKLLLGREVLSRLVVVMDGTRRQACLCEEANSQRVVG